MAGFPRTPLEWRDYLTRGLGPAVAAPTQVGVETPTRGLVVGGVFTHVPHSRDALTRAKGAKPRAYGKQTRGVEVDLVVGGNNE